MKWVVFCIFLFTIRYMSMYVWFSFVMSVVCEVLEASGCGEAVLVCISLCFDSATLDAVSHY
jgi:hypothetical protein